ncbi:TPA: riboflavin synthase [Candidatus Gracilibacteria bacterium]|nr:riboflavin synthase [Candidatus Gracilibacteria bacterium]
MFTGIIEDFVPVLKVTESSLVIKNLFGSDLKIGQSIACNGACLSVSSFTNEEISFDVLSETFRKTNLAETRFINIERAMLANGRFEGHVVLGHIDEVIIFLEKKEEISGIEFIFSLPKNTKYLVEKGSICLNGISLTIGNITDQSFSVFLIPLTLKHTNFEKINIGDRISLEYDYLGKLLLSQ